MGTIGSSLLVKYQSIIFLSLEIWTPKRGSSPCHFVSFLVFCTLFLGVWVEVMGKKRGAGVVRQSGSTFYHCIHFFSLLTTLTIYQVTSFHVFFFVDIGILRVSPITLLGIT